MFLPVLSPDIPRIEEQGRYAVELECPSLVTDTLHVVWPVRHAGVLDDQPTIRGQNEVRMPNPVPTSIKN